jgi:hypothetical protein
MGGSGSVFKIENAAGRCLSSSWFATERVSMPVDPSSWSWRLGIFQMPTAQRAFILVLRDPGYEREACRARP